MSLFEPREKSQKRIAIYLPVGQIDHKNIKNSWLGTEKKVKLKDGECILSSLVGQIDCKNTKEKSTILGNCVVNSFTKNSSNLC